MTTITNTARAGEKNDARRDAQAIGEIANDIVEATRKSLEQDNPYHLLSDVLSDAYNQAAEGKGKARHNTRRVAFDRQPIMEIGRMAGLGYQTGQAMKKSQEAVSMFNRGEHTAAEAELLGAINYLAAAVLLIREAK